MSDLSNKPVGAFFSPECGTCRGMTLREHFAGLAMMGELASQTEGRDYDSSKPGCEVMAIRSVAFADALIAELERTSGQEAKN